MADYEVAIHDSDQQLALECLQDLLFHKVGDITTGLTDLQTFQLLEMDFGFDIRSIILSALQDSSANVCDNMVAAVKKGIEDESEFFVRKAEDGAKAAFANASAHSYDEVVAAVEKGVENKSKFFTQKARAGAEAALTSLDIPTAITGGIQNNAANFITYAEKGSKKALAQTDLKAYAFAGAADALTAFDFVTPSKTGSLQALSTYDFVANAREGTKLAIEDKRGVLQEVATDGAGKAIIQTENTLVGYAQTAIGNKKEVITTAVEDAAVRMKLSTQEEVRVAILSAYSAYALALDNAKASLEQVVSRIINQTINLNDATVQYQVLLLSTSEAADRLSKTAEVFKDVVFTAERYASTVTDVLAIQELQKSVLDTTKVAINAISQLRSEWAGDRKELFDTMSEVRKLQDIGTKFDMAYKSLQVALGLTERVQEGIKMKAPEIIY